MLIKMMMTFAMLGVSFAYAENNSCVIRVVPVGKIHPQPAGTASEVQLPRFSQYAVIRERQGETANRSIEVIQNNITNRVSAEEQANNLGTTECPVQSGPRCQMQIAAPNKVIVRLSSLDKNNQERSSDVLVIRGAPTSSLQDNLNLLRDRQTQLGCNWERGEAQECQITRKFSLSGRAPEYSIQLGHSEFRGLGALSYEQVKSLAQEWNNSDGTPPTPTCHFSKMPDSLICSVDYRNGRPVVKYEHLGLSYQFADHESACQTLMERVTSGECGMSSPIGDDPCMHSGVDDNPRDPRPYDRFGDNLQTHEEAGPSIAR
ncbi:MAG: hypothetical protein AABY86_18310 [Bdellovibrionota bacterium]